MFDSVLDDLERELRTALNTAVTGLVTKARTRLEGAVADVAKERAKMLAEIAKERGKALAEVDTRRSELSSEIEAMQTHQAKQQGHVDLNIGGYRFQTSVQTLRRVPHTFFDAYFSGRYAQRRCAMTAAYSWTGTASTSGTSWSTCATAWCRWRSPARAQLCPCCVR